MAYPISSSPLPDLGDPDGDDYNRLREDVLINHVHDGISGSDVSGNVDHTLIQNIGTNSHPQIDSQLGALNTLLAGISSIQMGDTGLLVWTNGTDPFDYWEVTFPTAFTRVPYVWCQMYQNGIGQAKTWEGHVVTDRTVNSFRFHIVNKPDDNKAGFFWLALEPPA